MKMKQAPLANSFRQVQKHDLYQISFTSRIKNLAAEGGNVPSQHDYRNESDAVNLGMEETAKERASVHGYS
jgi:hypothetical protein